MWKPFWISFFPVLLILAFAAHGCDAKECDSDNDCEEPRKPFCEKGICRGRLMECNEDTDCGSDKPYCSDFQICTVEEDYPQDCPLPWHPWLAPRVPATKCWPPGDVCWTIEISYSGDVELEEERRTLLGRYHYLGITTKNEAALYSHEYTKVLIDGNHMRRSSYLLKYWDKDNYWKVVTSPIYISDEGFTNDTVFESNKCDEMKVTDCDDNWKFNIKSTGASGWKIEHVTVTCEDPSKFIVGEWIIQHDEGQNAITVLCSEKSENTFECLTKRGLEQGRVIEVTWNGKTYVWTKLGYTGVPSLERGSQKKMLTWTFDKDSNPTPVKWLRKI